MLPFGNVRGDAYDYAVQNTRGETPTQRLRDRLDAKAATARSGYSAKDLAEEVGVSGAAVSRYLNGEREPSAGILARIAKVLNTTVDYLQGLTDDPRRPEAPALPLFIFDFATSLAGLSEDGVEELREAAQRVISDDERRRQDIRERELYAQIADELLDDEEGKQFAEALLFARSGDMDSATRIVGDILSHFRNRIQ